MRQVNLIDDQQIGPGDTRPALARDLVARRHVDHIDGDVGQLGRECRGQVIATGGLSDLAKESVTNISAVVKKLTGKDIKDYDLHVQFPGTHNVDGDSASITMATAIISAFEGVPIEQNLAMTGSLTVRGEVLPIGGVSAKIEAAAKSGIRKVIIPKSNLNDVLIDEKFEEQVEILAVDSLDEVLEHALVGKEEKISLVERLAKVIDTFSAGTDKQPSA